MYRKIWGLKQLEKMQFPYPPYVVIDISGDQPVDVKKYVIGKVREVGLPRARGDRIGVTIRVSMPGPLDKLAKHGGLHVTEEGEVLKRVIDKYEQYGPKSKIVIQHTVDARCSGAILKEDDLCVIEAILGDAPPLLEGYATNYEKWVILLESCRWHKERVYMTENRGRSVLTEKGRYKLEKYVKLLPSHAYLEWSISKCGKLYFYEYCKLNNEHC
jgi:hypothetical protein